VERVGEAIAVDANGAVVLRVEGKEEAEGKG
jgi:hypothetical protein